MGSSVERGDYILMERIVAPVFTNYFLPTAAGTAPSPVSAIDELGVFGVFVR